MKIIDISVTVPKAPVYPGDPLTTLNSVLSIESGESCNLTEINMSAHAGTHADAPFHFIDDGKKIDSMPPYLFCGKTRVITVYKEEGNIEKTDLESFDIKRGERLLFKTRNSIDGHIFDSDFYMDFCAVSADAARFLADRGTVLLGIDYASIGSGESMAQTHRILLESGAAVLEWLNLTDVCDGEYFLSAAPMKLAAEGAPVRALLFETENEPGI